MANPIAEAFVRIRPDFSAFEQELKLGLANSFGGATAVPAGTQSRLAQSFFGPSFTSATNTAFQQAINTSTSKIPTSTQATLAQQLFGPGFRNESGRAIQGALVGLGQGQLAARFAFFGAGGAAIAGIASGFAVATNAAADFDQALTVLQATTGATDEELNRAAEAARNLGRDLELPGVNATDAANAILELAKAGLSMDDAIAGVNGTLRLAAAAQIDAGTAARIAASGLNAFQLAGEDAAHVADLLAGASIAAQGDISDMALSLQQSAAVASQAGLSIEQLVGLITELARQGILGSDAGTSLRTFLLRLAPTTKEAAQFMEALNVQLDQNRTIGEQLPDILDQYQRSLARLTPIQRQQALQQIFGTDAIRSATVAFREGAAGLEEAIDASNKQGAAADLAAAQSEGAKGAFVELSDAGASLAVTLGDVTLPAIESLTRGLTDLVVAADLGVGALGDLIAADLGRLDQIFGGAEEPAANLQGRIEQINEELQESLEHFGDFGESFDRVLSGDARLPLEASVTALVQELHDELEPAIRSGRLRIEEVREILADLHLPPELANAFRDLVPEATEQLDVFEHGRGRLIIGAEDVAREVGTKYVETVANTISEEDAKAIRAAQETLEEIRREGDRQITEAIRSARGSLESLGESLSSDIADIIDVGPIGQAIEAIDEQLDALQESVSRRQLRFDLTEAKQDLREAKEAIAQTGQLTPEQKRGQEEFLKPFREKVKDAQAALQEFKLEDKKKDLEDTRDAAQKAAEEGIAKLVQRFEDGKISANEFAKLLNNQLGPAFDTLNSKAGKNLGLVFTRDFKREVAALIEQAKALSAFFPLGGGTTPGPQVVRPAETQSEVNQRIAEQAADIREMRREARENAQDSEDKQDTTNALLRRIAKAVEGGTRTGDRPR